MATDAIDLESVRIRYDHRDGAFRLTSADPRLKGKPFLVTLSRDSRAVSSLLDLFQEEGIIAEGDLLPRSVSLKDAKRYDTLLDEYAIAGLPRPHQDSRLIFALGKTSSRETVSIDLGYAAHTLITGATGTGKTSALATLAAQAAARNGAESVWLLDPLGENYKDGISELSAVRGGRGVAESRVIGETVAEVLHERLELLRFHGLKNSPDYEAAQGPMEPIFLFADHLEAFEGIGEGTWARDILGFGEQVSIHLVANLYSPRSAQAIGTNRFGRTIALGEPRSPERSGGISPRLLSNIGRGVLRTDGSKPTVLQLALAEREN